MFFSFVPSSSKDATNLTAQANSSPKTEHNSWHIGGINNIWTTDIQCGPKFQSILYQKSPLFQVFPRNVCLDFPPAIPACHRKNPKRKKEPLAFLAQSCKRDPNWVMTHRGWEPNAGTGCHFHAVSGHPLIKVRAAADHIGMPLRNTHSDWRPTESSWVPESHSHTGATFPGNSQ